MAPFTLEELQRQYDNFKRVSDHCAETADYNAFADLFTDDCPGVKKDHFDIENEKDQGDHIMSD